MTSSEKDVSKKYKIVSFYLFTSLSNTVLESIIKYLNNNASKYNIKGTILMAKEGINGTICGPEDGINTTINFLNKKFIVDNLNLKVSYNEYQAFKRFKCKLKEEIVTMGVEHINPIKDKGKYVEPTDWNSFIDDPETLVIDTRNDYEIEIGTFKGSINPKTNCFRDFPKWVDKYLQSIIESNKYKKIAMFCTGGIRCEKATSYLKKVGFSDIHHLNGGILRYLSEVDKEESLWQGECFVFDQRVALNNNLLPGEYLLCYACGMPVSENDRVKSSYIRGVQCHYCQDIFTDQDRLRFQERQDHFDRIQVKEIN
tara:strand:+ start:7048 stop:7986 length:939 start_codon:yes stop_codon:yes gene_type:complete